MVKPPTHFKAPKEFWVTQLMCRALVYLRAELCPDRITGMSTNGTNLYSHDQRIGGKWRIIAIWDATSGRMTGLTILDTVTTYYVLSYYDNVFVEDEKHEIELTTSKTLVDPFREALDRALILQDLAEA